jgi:hypothetical protein
VVPKKPFAALVTLYEVSYMSEMIFIVFCKMGVVFETFTFSCAAPVKIIKDLLPALPVLA